MYICTDCGRKFEKLDVIFERHYIDFPPFEGVAVCPFCKSTNVKEEKIKRCHYCGIRLVDKQDFCSKECREMGTHLWQIEQRRRRKNTTHPLNIMIREVEQYNREHGTCYTYGQYISRILPTITKKGKKSYNV